MIEETIKKKKAIIDKCLKIYLSDRLKRMEKIGPMAKELMGHMMEFNLRGGKRIRPILVVYGYLACGGRSNAIYDAALAVELMESFLLVHDDIMDQDEMRRGYLTMHKVFEAKCERCYKADAKRYGESMALITGDILSVLGNEVLLKSRFPVEMKLRAMDRFNRAVVNTCVGQAMDVRAAIDPNVTEADIAKMYELKTAIYTLEAPLHIGAHLAGASSSHLRALSAYAIPLGKAFQMRISGLPSSHGRELLS